MSRDVLPHIDHSFSSPAPSLFFTSSLSLYLSVPLLSSFPLPFSFLFFSLLIYCFLLLSPSFLFFPPLTSSKSYRCEMLKNFAMMGVSCAEKAGESNTLLFHFPFPFVSPLFLSTPYLSMPVMTHLSRHPFIELIGGNSKWRMSSLYLSPPAVFVFSFSLSLTCFSSISLHRGISISFFSSSVAPCRWEERIYICH